jgi:hypothetical protein
VFISCRKRVRERVELVRYAGERDREKMEKSKKRLGVVYPLETGVE